MPKITILFDNRPNDGGFPTFWGFSCLVETPDTTLLFDTGSNGRVLLKNMAALGVDPAQIDILAISHRHWDHIGGLDSVTEANPNLHLFLPASLSRFLIRDLQSLSKAVTVVGKEAATLRPAIHTTGIMGEIGEQALILDTPEGLAVITGCAHPGIVAIAERAMALHGKPVRLLMGGFHLMNADAPTIAATIEALRRLEVAWVCPTHCTGDLAIGMFAEAYGERCIAGGTGRVITL